LTDLPANPKNGLQQDPQRDVFMFRYTPILALLFSIFTSVKILAAEPQWESVKNEDGIHIYLRDVSGSDIQAFKGEVKIQSSIESLLALLLDEESCPEWVYQCIEPAVVERVSEDEHIFYQANDMPFPSTNRDVLFRMRITEDPTTKVATVYFENTADYCKKKDSLVCKKINRSEYVRIQTFTGFYQFTPAGNGWTHVTWEQHIEPGGNLPNWLVNSLLVDIPFNSLKGMVALISRYQK
jgi:hypothetical protein